MNGRKLSLVSLENNAGKHISRDLCEKQLYLLSWLYSII